MKFGAFRIGRSRLGIRGDIVHKITTNNLVLLAVTAALLNACGAQDSDSQRSSRSKASSDQTAADTRAEEPRLARDSNEQVLGTLVIPFSSDVQSSEHGYSLISADGEVVRWMVDMEQREPVKAGVAPKKYLRVTGDLSAPMEADNKPYDVGCLFVELKDNVYYREKTWLRIATTGIKGTKYQEVVLPLKIDMGGWKNVPVLEESLDLQRFAGNILKKFDGTVCFQLDFTNAPSQTYEGEIIVQYLRPTDAELPKPCGMNDTRPECQPTTQPPVQPEPPKDVFSCEQAPVSLKAKQAANFSWKGAPSALTYKLSADPATYPGALGTVASLDAKSVRYTAPDAVSKNVRILISAKSSSAESLPAVCEVMLVADEEIGVPDDGETKGLAGNVFLLPVNTSKLPNLDAMTPVAHVLAPNLDIPERAFSQGFPGVRDLVEWFGIRFRGRINIPADGVCKFKITSDDGANLYIDKQKIVDNDGTHPTQSKEGQVSLSKGWHEFRVDYYQGPRYHITLQAFWKCGSAANYTVIPPEAFERPLE